MSRRPAYAGPPPARYPPDLPEASFDTQKLYSVQQCILKRKRTGRPASDDRLPPRQRISAFVESVLSSARQSAAPNPATTVCRIVGLETAPVSVELFDMRGKLLMRGHKTEFDVRTLPSGMYTVRVNTGERVVNLKLIRK